MLDKNKNIPPTVLKYKGIFDIGALYKFMSHWLINEGFEFYETKYKHKPPKIEINWEANKRITSYVKYIMEIHFYFYGVNDVEVIKDGAKRKMQDARVVITFSGKVETDYPDIYGDKNWEKNKFFVKAKKFFENYIIRQDLDVKHIDSFYYYILRFYEDVKSFLGMETVGGLS
ncbi:hypothetical protein COT07_02545 [Candidatus Woesearchaeota archaeon CG07_land_8_20_14_0_80_44_23]|nr:MAG: hypothetical protein COT07_02545 [Candidatus Woesearchaeota archaeon CG07_land_8_20_14_0_80_44_23]